MAASGWTDSEIAVQMGVSVPTLYRWRKLHPDFDDAMLMAKKIADDRVEGVMYRTAIGYDYVEQQAIKVKTGPDTEAVEVVDVIRHQPASDAQVRFWLKNRRRGEWTDQTDVNLTGDINVNVTADPRALAIAMIATLRAGIEAPAPTIEHEEPAK